MNIKPTEIDGLMIVEPRVFRDDRGYFFESFSHRDFENAGLSYSFVQSNQSFSRYGTVRGLHFQRGEHAQAKLVRVIVGKVLDVAVDLREGSPTFGRHVCVELSGDNCLQLLIPRGFAHGFSVLSDTALFVYQCDNYYHKESEGGIRFDDPVLDIDWRVPDAMRITSDKDKALLFFKDFTPDIGFFPFHSRLNS